MRKTLKAFGKLELRNRKTRNVPETKRSHDHKGGKVMQSFPSRARLLSGFIPKRWLTREAGSGQRRHRGPRGERLHLPSSRSALHSRAWAGTDVSSAATLPTHGQSTRRNYEASDNCFSFNYKHLDILLGWGLSVTQASHEFLDSSNPPAYFPASWATHTFHSTASYFRKLKAILHQSKNTQPKRKRGYN